MSHMFTMLKVLSLAIYLLFSQPFCEVVIKSQVSFFRWRNWSSKIKFLRREHQELGVTITQPSCWCRDGSSRQSSRIKGTTRCWYPKPGSEMQIDNGQGQAGLQLWVHQPSLDRNNLQSQGEEKWNRDPGATQRAGDHRFGNWRERGWRASFSVLSFSSLQAILGWEGLRTYSWR